MFSLLYGYVTGDDYASDDEGSSRTSSTSSGGVLTNALSSPPAAPSIPLYTSPSSTPSTSKTNIPRSYNNLNLEPALLECSLVTMDETHIFSMEEEALTAQHRIIGESKRRNSSNPIRKSPIDIPYGNDGTQAMARREANMAYRRRGNRPASPTVSKYAYGAASEI